MAQESAASTEDERVAFTLRLDTALVARVEDARTVLAQHLGVSVSKNDFFARMAAFYLAHPQAHEWVPTNGTTSKKGGR